MPELHSIYRSAPVGLGVLDTQLRFFTILERLAEMNGLPVEAHIGKQVSELLPDLAAQAETVLRRVLETGEPLLDVEIRGVTPAQPGVERIWREKFNPLRDEAGTIVAISASATALVAVESCAASAESASRWSPCHIGAMRLRFPLQR